MQQIYPYLAYAGAIPFMMCAVCLLCDIGQLPWLGSIENILGAYGMVISNFLAGAHWGQHLHMEKKWCRLLPLLSNLVAVALWLAFLTLTFKSLMIAFVLAFLILLRIDHSLLQNNVITRHYFQTRCLVTGIVLLALVIAGFFS